MPHKQARRLTPPGRKSTLSGRKLFPMTLLEFDGRSVGTLCAAQTGIIAAGTGKAHLVPQLTDRMHVHDAVGILPPTQQLGHDLHRLLGVSKEILEPTTE